MPDPTPSPMPTLSPSPEPSPAPQNFDIRQHIDDSGKFKPGWTKAAGVADTYEAKFTEPAAIIRSYANAEKMIGADKIILPGPNATQVERDAFYTKLGRPTKPEEYGFMKPDKIGDRAIPDTAWDKDRAARWQQKLFDMGVPKDTAQKIMLEAVSEGVEGMDKINQAQATFQKQAKEQLVKEWGVDYDKNLGAARRVAEQFGDKELIEHPALGNDPVLLRFMAKVGAQFSERPGAGVRQTNGDSGNMTPADAKAAAHKLTGEMAQRIKADRSFKSSPEYAQMADRKTALFKIAYPES